MTVNAKSRGSTIKAGVSSGVSRFGARPKPSIVAAFRQYFVFPSRHQRMRSSTCALLPVAVRARRSFISRVSSVPSAKLDRVESTYRLQDFDFSLAPELIAQAPPATRSESRLLRVGDGALVDGRFTDLPQWLTRGDLMIFNDTRVIKARAVGVKPTGGRVEMLVERIVGSDDALDEHL